MGRKFDGVLGEKRCLQAAVKHLNLKVDAFPLAMLKAKLEEVGLVMSWKLLVS